MSISINQGDYVLYQDISVGNPTSRNWNFPGGTPTGSVSLNPIIRYLSPSGSGFNAKLTVTKATVSSTKEESNIIVVLPESISVTLSTNVTVSSVHMGTTVTYTALGATGNLSYYTWNIAGLAGFTGTSQTQSSTLYSWIDLTGSELGAPYSTYTSTSSVVFNSILGNTSSSNTNVTYSKNGGFEPYNYLSDVYTLGVNYYNVIDTGVPLGLLGMSGSGNAYLVDTNYASALPINNTQFRAQGETTVYWSSSQDIEFLPSISGGFFGQYIASQSAFQALGVAPTGWEFLSRYTQGNYMIPNDLFDYFFSVFYFADTAGFGKILTNNRFWTPPQVEALIFNEVSIGYQSSRALELSPGIPPVAYFVGLDGVTPGFNPGGPCLPSATFIGSATVEIYLTLRYSPNGSISGIDPGLDVVIPVLVSSGPGNSPDGNLVVAQDTLGGVGIASLINDAITTAGLTGYIGATASPDYSWESNSGLYDINAFNGLKIAILDRDTGPFLVAIDLSDNGPWAPYPYEAFPSTPGVINWLGFNTNRVANPYQTNYIDLTEPVRGWFFGNP
jgi:hypothetical protein